MKDYLESELQKICLLEAKTNPTFISIDEATDIYNQIQMELLSFKSFKDINDNEIEDFMRNIENDNQLSLEETICPICQKANLLEANSMIACSATQCPFKIDMNKSGMDLSQLTARLQSLIRQHTCDEIPRFQFKSSDAITNNDLVMLNQFTSGKQVSFYLIATCDNCNFLDVIA